MFFLLLLILRHQRCLFSFGFFHSSVVRAAGLPPFNAINACSGFIFILFYYDFLHILVSLLQRFFLCSEKAVGYELGLMCQVNTSQQHTRRNAGIGTDFRNGSSSSTNENKNKSSSERNAQHYWAPPPKWRLQLKKKIIFISFSLVFIVDRIASHHRILLAFSGECCRHGCLFACYLCVRSVLIKFVILLLLLFLPAFPFYLRFSSLSCPLIECKPNMSRSILWEIIMMKVGNQ